MAEPIYDQEQEKDENRPAAEDNRDFLRQHEGLDNPDERDNRPAGEVPGPRGSTEPAPDYVPKYEHRSPEDDDKVYKTAGNEPSTERGEPLASTAETGSSRKKAPNREELSDKEKSATEPALAETAQTAQHENQVGRGYRHSGTVKHSWATRNRRKLVFAGGGASLIIIPIILFLAFFLPSLKIPQLAAEIEGYRLARLSRTFYNNASVLTADKSALDASTATNVDNLTGKTPFGKALSLYHPNRVINNMKASGILSFESSAVGKLDAMIVKLGDGTSTRITVPDLKYGSLSDFQNNYQERLRLAAETKAAINQALEGSNFLVRSKVARVLESANGINLYWWERAGLAFSGKNQQAAEVLEAQQTEQRIAQIPSEDLRTSTLKNAADQAEQATKKCFQSASCTEQAVADDGIAPSAKSVVNGINISTSSALGIINPAYAVAFPVCIAYDASANVAQTFLNQQNAAAMRVFFAVASGAAQQESGDVTSEAVQALANQAGDTYNSVPTQIARNDPKVSTANEISPASGRGADFSIFNAFDSLFGGNGNSTTTKIANWFAGKLCPAATNTDVAPALAALNVITLLDPAAFDVESSAESSIAGVAKEIGSNIIAQIKSRVTFNAVRNTAIQTGTSDAASQGLTYLARMLVFSQIGSFINGLDKNDFANQADMGAVAYDGQMVQQETFGRPLTPSETSGVETRDLGYVDAQKQNQSTSQKLFALSNPNSFFGSLAMRASGMNLGSISSFILGFPHFVVSSIGSASHLFIGHSLAATPPSNVDYGMVQFGWSTDEEDLINKDSSYDPLVNDQIVNDPSNQAAVVQIAQKYAKCFGYTASSQGGLSQDNSPYIGNLINGAEGDIPMDKNGNVKASGATCSPSNLSYNSTDPLAADNDSQSSHRNDLIFRWRLDQSYQNTLTELEGIQNVGGTSNG